MEPETQRKVGSLLRRTADLCPAALPHAAAPPCTHPQSKLAAAARSHSTDTQAVDALEAALQVGRGGLA